MRLYQGDTNVWLEHVLQNVWLNANVRPQETTETKYNGPVEDKKYYLFIKKSYTCSSYQDKCFHLIFFIRQSNTDFTLLDGCCQEELDHNTYLARWLQKNDQTDFPDHIPGHSHPTLALKLCPVMFTTQSTSQRNLLTSWSLSVRVCGVICRVVLP